MIISTTPKIKAPDWGRDPAMDRIMGNAKEGPRFMTNVEFVNSFKTPDWVIEDVLPRGDIYALTGHAKTGKTATAQAIAKHVATGTSIGPYAVPQGRVMYLAGENPDNIKKRWVVMLEESGINPTAIDVHWYNGEAPLRKVVADAEAYANNISKPFDLVIVDTKTAYSEGEEENTTEDAMEDARGLRQLTGLPGNPHVLALCHPAAAAKRGKMTPRGGKAFMGAIDGNIEAWNLGNRVELNCTASREAPFDPLFFDFQTITSATRMDAKGRPIRTFMVKPAIVSVMSTTPRLLSADAVTLLRALKETPCRSFAKHTEMLAWGPSDGRVKNRMADLAEKGMVEKACEGGSYSITPIGEAFLQEPA